MANHIDGLEMEAWGDVPLLTGHTLFAEAATEWRLRAEKAEAERDELKRELGAVKKREQEYFVELSHLQSAITRVMTFDVGESFADVVIRYGVEYPKLISQLRATNKRAKQAEAELGAAINQRNKAQRFVNENYDLIRYWRDLFKRANAAKRKARTDARVLRAYGVE